MVVTMSNIPNTTTYKFLFAPTQDIVFAAHTEYFTTLQNYEC